MARVVVLSTCTLALAATPTDELAATPAATVEMSSSPRAVITRLPSARPVTPEPMRASVVLLTVLTTAPRPTPTLPDAATDPATDTMSVSSLLRMRKSAWLAPDAVPTAKVAPSSTRALVVSFSTFTTTEPATAALLDAPPPTAMVTRFSLDVAATSTPSVLPAAMAVPAPTRAWVRSLCTSTVLLMPMPAELP